jgi:hypothetical protein
VADSPKFFNGANLIIKIGDKTMAYATGISFQHGMATAPIQVLGAIGSQGLEPLSYSASGSFSVLSFVNKESGEAIKPENKINIEKKATADTSNNDQLGNSSYLLHESHMNHRKILLSEVFDIEILAKQNTKDLRSIYKLIGCRLTDWSLSFSPGQLASERYGFVCKQITFENHSEVVATQLVTNP